MKLPHISQKMQNAIALISYIHILFPSPFHNILNMSYGISPHVKNIYAIYSIKSNN